MKLKKTKIIKKNYVSILWLLLYIHTLAVSLQETATQLTESLATLISQLHVLHSWKAQAPLIPPQKDTLLVK